MRLGLRVSAWQYPFEPMWNRPVFTAVKRAVRIPLFAVGGIRTPDEAAGVAMSARSAPTAAGLG